jgi:plasmid maintenance system antidote protein VapI
MPSIADLIRREIKRSELNLNALAKATGILQPPLWRFVNGPGGINLDSAEKLLNHFGYAVVKKRAPANQLSAAESSKRTKPRRRA